MPFGVYAADGSLRVTVVDGNTRTGRYAPDGSTYVVVSPGSELVGYYHPCGALWVTVSGATVGVYAPDGSMYVTEDIDDNTGAIKVTVVSGDLSGGGAPVWVPEDALVYADFQAEQYYANDAERVLTDLFAGVVTGLTVNGLEVLDGNLNRPLASELVRDEMQGGFTAVFEFVSGAAGNHNGEFFLISDDDGPPITDAFEILKSIPSFESGGGTLQASQWNGDYGATRQFVQAGSKCAVTFKADGSTALSINGAEVVFSAGGSQFVYDRVYLGWGDGGSETNTSEMYFKKFVIYAPVADEDLVTLST